MLCAGCGSAVAESGDVDMDDPGLCPDCEQQIVARQTAWVGESGHHES